MSQTIISDRTTKLATNIDRFAFVITRHWLLLGNIALGALVLAPFAAPVLMAVGTTGPANAIYFFYSFLCHQLPQRSLFLFGAKASYSLAEIGAVWQYDNFFALREFVGNAAMGWKVAWSDRMVAMYGSLWLGGMLHGWLRGRHPEQFDFAHCKLRKRTRLSPILWLLLAIVPMGVDGFSHVVNDLVAGITGTGFRDTNEWLRIITANIFPATFYAGDALGSFNNLARLGTGALFGFATIWFVYPIIDSAIGWNSRR